MKGRWEYFKVSILSQFLNCGRRRKVLRQFLTHCSHLLIATSFPSTDQKRKKRSLDDRNVDLRPRENRQLPQLVLGLSDLTRIRSLKNLSDLTRIRSQDRIQISYRFSFEIRVRIQIRNQVIYMFHQTSNYFFVMCHIS